MTPTPKSLQIATGNAQFSLMGLAPWIDPANPYGGGPHLFEDCNSESSVALWLFRVVVSSYATLGLLTVASGSSRVPITLQAYEAAHGSLSQLTQVPRWDSPLVEGLRATLTAFHAYNAIGSENARTTIPYLFARDNGGTVMSS